MSCWQHGSLFPSSMFHMFHLFVKECLVVNLIFYHLPTCSTSFLEAFISGLSLIVNSSIHIAISFSYCEIFSLVFFTSSSCSFGFSLASYLHASDLGKLWSWISSTPTWYQSLPVASCLKDFFLSRDSETQTLVYLWFFLQSGERGFDITNLIFFGLFPLFFGGATVAIQIK